MKKTWLLIIVILLLSSTLSGQFKPGYIIENDNDTTYGYINFEGSALNCNHCSFRSLPDSEEHVYYPGEIKAFRFEGSKYFMTAKIKENNESKKVFLEWMVKGRASILSYNSMNMKTRFFILPENDTLTELVNTTKTIMRKDEKSTNTHDILYQHSQNEYIGTLLYYLRDCPSIKNNIQTTALSNGPLIKISKKYQEKTCPGIDCELFEDKDRALRIDVGGSVSYMFSKLKLNNGLAENSPVTGSMGIGVGFNLSNLPLVSPKFSFTARVTYYNLTYTYDTDLYYITDNRICSFKYLRIPWQINYTISHKKFSPFIALGVSTNIRFGGKTFNSDNSLYYAYLLNFSEGISRFQMGLSGGLGFRYSISPQIALNMKFDYEHALRFVGTSVEDLSYNNNVFFEASVFYRLK
jgi:hypothetical protein